MKMEFKSINDMIKQHIRFGQHWKKKVIRMSDAKWQQLTEDTAIDQYTFAKGTTFKVFETSNFGWLVFGPDARTPEGHIPARRIFKW